MKTFKQILKDFFKWYAPADGDIFEALLGFIAKYPEHPRNHEKATAARLTNYAARIGIDLEDYSQYIYLGCCGSVTAYDKADAILSKLN